MLIKTTNEYTLSFDFFSITKRGSFAGAQKSKIVMNLSLYPYEVSLDYKEYEFFSEGPKGRIKKRVIYEKISDNPQIYNLAFGDVDPVSDMIRDRSTSNNNDRDLVLATVAHTVGDFVKRYAQPLIYIEGSTKSRTRLYQISLNKIVDEVQPLYTIYGYRANAWEAFRKSVNYEAFVVQQKKIS